jgi:FtsH-binding integral membrane protein
MPKLQKTRSKSKTKAQTKKVEPEPASITTKKSYWISLLLFTAIAVSLAAYAINLAWLNIAVLTVTVVVLIGFIGYIRVTPSTMPVSRRATFLFVGASVIGFCIWTAIILVFNTTGFTVQVAEVLGGHFFIVTSFVICLTSGALIGDLISKINRVKAHFNNKT